LSLMTAATFVGGAPPNHTVGVGSFDGRFVHPLMMMSTHVITPSMVVRFICIK
jgi:hypothetical protein